MDGNYINWIDPGSEKQMPRFQFLCVRMYVCVRVFMCAGVVNLDIKLERGLQKRLRKEAFKKLGREKGG